MKAAVLLGVLGLGTAAFVATRPDADPGVIVGAPAIELAARLGEATQTIGPPQLLPNLGGEPRPLADGRDPSRRHSSITLAQHDDAAPAPALDLDELESPFADLPTVRRDAPAPPAAGPADVPGTVRALEEAAPALPADKPVSFNFQSAPWELVLTRFAEHVGVPLEMEVVPPGTLTHQDARTFTPAEALHVLNHLLRPTGCGIVQDGRRLLVSDLRRLSAAPDAQPAPAAVSVPAAVARMQMRMAKIDLTDGHLDAAHDTARQAAEAQVAYGLFDERPAALLRDIEQRRASAPLPPAPQPPATLPPASVEAARHAAPAPEARPAGFAFQPASWGSVLQQYASASGLTLRMPEAPAGEMTHRDPRPQSTAEAFDTLNGLLFPQGYFLARNESALTVLKLSEGIPRRLIRETQPHELAAMGRSDLACIVLPVPEAHVDAVDQQVRPLLGPLGGTERLTEPSRLRVIDTAGNLLRVTQSLDGMRQARAATR